LRREGFVIVPQVVPADMVSRLVAAIGALEPSATALSRGDGVYAVRDLLRQVPATRALAECPPVSELVESVLGTGAFVVRGLLFDKTAEANWTVPWHQDLTIAVRARKPAPGFRAWTVKGGIPHVQPPVAVLERMLTVRVQLDESDASQGPLRVLPGSHRHGRLNAESTADWLRRVPPIACVVPRGGALLMSPLVLHASSPATEPRHRRVVHLEYAADPLPEGVDWFETPELAR
jgi:ectoine hydroxylase-related dioxygenase (phytanoyl-CoA dioxygenase family)